MAGVSNPRAGMRAAALLWALSSLLPAGTVLLASSQWGPLAVIPRDALTFGGGVALVCLIASFLAPPKLDRVLPSRLLMGFGLSALLFLTSGVGFAFLLAPTISPQSKWLSVALFFVAAVLWCATSLSSFRRRVMERRFIEREFSSHAEQVVLRHPVQTDLDAPPISDKTVWGKFFHGVGSFAVMAVPLAYPVQRLLTETASFASVLVLLAVLCMPLTLYILGRMTCGAYLWIYKVWQMERQYGKPVVFDAAE